MELYNSVFQNFSKLKDIHRYSRFTDQSLSIAERVVRTRTKIFKKPVFEKCSRSWISELSSIIKKYNITKRHSMKLTPVQSFWKISGKKVFSNLQDKRKKRKPQFQLGDLIQPAEIKEGFQNWKQYNLQLRTTYHNWSHPWYNSILSVLLFIRKVQQELVTTIITNTWRKQSSDEKIKFLSRK